MKLTPEQQAEKKRKDINLKLCNQVKSYWSLKKIRTFADLYAIIGTPPNTTPEQLSKAVTIVDIRATVAEIEKDSGAAALPKPAPVPVKEAAPTSVPTLPPTPVPQVTTTTSVTEPLPQEPEAHKDDADNDYGLVPSPKEKVFLYWFQKKAIKQLCDMIFEKHFKSALVLAATGTGKTFIAGGIIRRMLDRNFHQGKTFGFVRYLYVTRATIVEQTDRVFKDFFGITILDAVEVLNIEQLRSRAGEKWVDQVTYMEDGVEKMKWVWKQMLNPCVVLWDECQALKNEGSTQHEIATALNDVPNVTQIFISATPFTKVSEAKCFAVSTGKDISKMLGRPNYTPINNLNWQVYAGIICKDSKPTDHNEAAVDRLVTDLEDHIVRVRGVRPQFDAINSVKLINFKTEEERKEYNDAWEKYQKEKEKLRQAAIAVGKDPEQESDFQILVMFLKFRMAAERVRRRYIADWLMQQVNNGFAAVAALNFKGTIIDVVKILVDEYKIPRSKISLVWGGGQTQMTKKQKTKQEILEKADELKKVGISSAELLKTLDLTDVDDRVLQDLPAHLQLGAQSKEQRQKEIDRFQSGRSVICLYTFRAGGVGLSLHHTDEQSPIKVRKKKSGYAYEEDISKVPIRPRKAIVAPTYSAIELVQGLGRCPRLTSLSNTEQELVYYRGTIEEDVAAITSNKLRCLSKVVRQRESWVDVITTGHDVKSHITEVNGNEEKGTNYDDLVETDETEEEE